MKSKKYSNRCAGLIVPLSIMSVILSACGQQESCDYDDKFSADGRKLDKCDDDRRTFVYTPIISSTSNGKSGYFSDSTTMKGGTSSSGKSSSGG